MPNVSVYVLDHRLRPVPVGSPGEVWIGGAGVAQGYRGRPGHTADRFRPDTFATAPGALMYRTGDRGRMLPGGDLVLLGRVDRQVKVRGIRVEPEEVEAVLAGAPGVRQAMVTVGAGGTGAGLVGYLVREPGTTPDLRAVAAHAARVLPRPVCPVSYGILDRPPLTPNGKIDFAALAGVPTRPVAAGRQPDPPATPTQRQVAAMCAEVLGADEVAAHVDFFELGGHSLLLARLIGLVRERFAVEVPARDVLLDPTVATIAALVDAGCKAPPDVPRRRTGRRVTGSGSGRSPPAPPCEYEEAAAMPNVDPGADLEATLVPATDLQERLWLAQRLATDQPLYQMPIHLSLHGPLDVDALHVAFARCVARHEALRTAFDTVGGRLHQVIVDPPGPRVSIPVIDLSGEPPAGRRARRRELAERQHTDPLDPAELPLLRAQLVVLDEQQYELHLTVHHTVCDGASVEQLIGELVDEYAAAVRGEPSPVPAPGAGLAEWTGRRLALAGSPTARMDLEYWQDRLRGVPPVLELPTDRPRQRKAPDQAMTHRFCVDQPLLDRLRELSRDSGVSLFSTLLTALAVVLHRYTGQPDLCVGVPISLRDDADLERTLGPLLNMVAVRLTSTPGSTFRDLLGVTSRAVREAMAHGSVPFERVVDALNLPGVAGATPLFQVMFTHERVAARRWEVAGLRIAAEIVPFPLARNDLVLAVEESELWLDAPSNTAPTSSTPTGSSASPATTPPCPAAVATPDRPVAALPLLTAEERDLIVHSWNDTAAPFPDRVTVAFSRSR